MDDSYATLEYTDAISENLQSVKVDNDKEELDMIQNTLNYLIEEQDNYSALVEYMWDSMEEFTQTPDCAILQKLSRHDQQKFFDLMNSQKHPKMLAVAKRRLTNRYEYLTQKIRSKEQV